MYIDIWVLMLNSVKLNRKNRHALSERFEKKSIIIFYFLAYQNFVRILDISKLIISGIFINPISIIISISYLNFFYLFFRSCLRRNFPLYPLVGEGSIQPGQQNQARD